MRKTKALLAASLAAALLFGGCGEQNKARSFGGEMNLNLKPNQKLLEITWKDSDLWYLTREMRDDEEAEDYTFQESTWSGVLEGTVFVHETKMSDEEYEAWLADHELEEDYFKPGNLIRDEEDPTRVTEEFIHWDEENDAYVKIKDYVEDETTGALVPANE